MIRAGDFVDFWSGGEHLYARVEKVKTSLVTGTKVTVEAFLSVGKDKSMEDTRIRKKTVPLEYLMQDKADVRGPWTWNLTLRELYEVTINR